MIGDTISRSIQEDLITLLCHSDEHGAVVAGLARPEMFEAECRLIAEKAMEYWREYKTAPKLHSTDILKEILEDETDSRRKRLYELLYQMSALIQGINAIYVLRQLRIFVRMQQLKAAFIEAVGHLNDTSGMGVEQVERILGEVQRARHAEFEPGLRLSDYEVLLQEASAEPEFDTGILLLDRRHIVPIRGTLMTLIGASGSGKSFACVQIGKRACLQRKRVLHLTLEMDEARVLRRYYQSIFAVPRYDVPVEITTFAFAKDASDREDRTKILDMVTMPMRPEFHLASPSLREELAIRIETAGRRLRNLVIKQFPTGSLTMEQLRGYLDLLEGAEHFVPDLVIIDYPKLMKISSKEFRIQLGLIYTELRGLMGERNMAGFVVHQASKKGAEARQITSGHVAEDWSIIHTSDVVLTFSATREERARGLGRIYVDKARDEADKFGMVVTQNYAIGQFVLDCAPLSTSYFDYIDKLDRTDAAAAKHGATNDGEDEED